MLYGKSVDVIEDIVCTGYWNAKDFIESFYRWDVGGCSGSSYDYYERSYYPSYGNNIVEEWLAFISFLSSRFNRKFVITKCKFNKVNCKV